MQIELKDAFNLKAFSIQAGMNILSLQFGRAMP